jgi:hypothetical protein
MTLLLFSENLLSESIIHMILFLYTIHFTCEIMIIEQIIVNKIELNLVIQEKEWQLILSFKVYIFLFIKLLYYKFFFITCLL